MTIKLVTIMEDGLGAVAKAIVSTTAEDYTALQELFQRGANNWPDAPASIKAIADMVTSGKIMQHYVDQPRERRK